MRCEFRFKAAVQATERVARFRVFLTDHIYGQLVILKKPHVFSLAPMCPKTCECMTDIACTPGVVRESGLGRNTHLSGGEGVDF
jgi:hypothetical protein